MSGCHIPAMSGFERDGDKLFKHCHGCNEKLDACKCAWAAIRKLQDDILSVEGQLEGLNDHIENLQVFESDSGIAINDIRKRIKKLERNLSLILDHQRKIEAPHKCPVCDGRRNIVGEIPNGTYFEFPCKSCEGKGIVWG